MGPDEKNVINVPLVSQTMGVSGKVSNIFSSRAPIKRLA